MQLLYFGGKYICYRISSAARNLERKYENNFLDYFCELDIKEKLKSFSFI